VESDSLVNYPAPVAGRGFPAIMDNTCITEV